MLFFGSRADAADPNFQLESIGEFSRAVQITHGGGAQIYVVERDGIVRAATKNGAVFPFPFLDIESLVNTSSEGGLLSIAFHPDFPATPFVFVSYTEDPTGPGLLDSVIARYTAVSPLVLNTQSRVELLRFTQPDDNHNGGQIGFGPDGMLYLAFGDGGGSNDPACRAQDRQQLFGKMLRIDVDQSPGAPPYYGIPSDNPFAGFGGLFHEEIWALGLRNPWRFSFDRDTGDLYIGDVGQGAVEEIDLQRAGTPGGLNFGWSVMEGNECHDPDPIDSNCPVGTFSCFSSVYAPPIHEYDSDPPDCAVTGGFVYRGNLIGQLRGRYVFGDYCSGIIRALSETAPGVYTVEELIDAGSGLQGFGEDNDGEIYVAFQTEVFRLTGPFQPVPLADARALGALAALLLVGLTLTLSRATRA